MVIGKKIKVVDSIMGSGKTNWAIEYINSNPDEKFCYITPYLDEIKRVKRDTRNFNKMEEPEFKDGNSKNHDFHRLLGEGKNICSTHALFQKADDFTREGLRANNYILILDEVMNVVEEMKDFEQDDLKTLKNENLAHIEDDFLIWNPDRTDYNGRYNDIKIMALNKNLVYINDRLLFWNFPVDIFQYFKEVYVLTYMFDCQVQRYYYDFHGMEFEKFQVDDDYKLIQYSKELYNERRIKLAPLINICDSEKYNNIGNAPNSLSFNWYKNYSDLLPLLQKNLYNWFNVKEARKFKANERLWTTFKDYKHKLKGKGYTKRMISINIRATNDYIDSKRLAYCCNRFLKPSIKIFFNKKGIEIDQDGYALSEMLQWIWRSQIRRGDKIEIYIPSKRMRELLINYLKSSNI